MRSPNNLRAAVTNFGSLQCFPVQRLPVDEPGLLEEISLRSLGRDAVRGSAGFGLEYFLATRVGFDGAVEL